jgi:hypothetical protein
MAQIVKLRRSSVSGQKPTNTNLQLGELALNTTDGKVFMAVSGSGGPSVQELIVTNTVNTGSIHLVGAVSASVISGSFIGDGSHIYNIPISGVTNLLTVSGSLDSRLDVLEAYSSSQQVPTSSYSFRTSQTDVYCKNITGAQIDKGKVVRIVGATGDNPLIELADYGAESNSANTLGITTENIPNDSFGLVITEGILLGVNTIGMTAGQLLYLGSSGSFTTTVPIAPNHGVRLGEVLRQQQNNGSIYVRIDNGIELGEAHDVLYTGLTSGDLLVRSGSVWKNSKSLSGSYSLTGSLNISGSQTIIGSQTVSGSMTVLNNLTVLGTASFLTVTSSNLDITGAFISVNVYEPLQRFGGIKVFDSGSSSATASLAWDSEHNHWIYQNVNGSTYTGGMLISGPRNTGSLGDEPTLTLHRIPVSDGGDHIKDSSITDDGIKVSISSSVDITGSLHVTNGITGSLDFINLINIPTLVSGSSQIEITGTTGYSTFSSSISSSISSLSSSISESINSLSTSVATTTNILDGRIDSLEIESGSIRSDFNSYTSSNNGRVNSIEGVTGSISFLNLFTSSYNTGSFTGSFIGDGSGLYNIPASGVTGLQLDRIINGSVSASLEDTKLRVNTDVIIDGTLTAKELYIDYVTSSVLYQSGSTKFGDTSDDIHQFTGSLFVSGTIRTEDLYVDGDIYLGTFGNEDRIVIRAQVSSSLIPDSDGDHQLGGEAQKWKIYGTTGSFVAIEGITGSNVTIRNASATGSFTGSFIGDAAGLVNVPFQISGSDVDGVNYNKTFTKLQFDDSTGLNVSESVQGTAFISIGSHFRDIFVSGSGMLRATGSDAFEVIGDGGIDITVSNTDTNTNGYTKELKFSTLNLSSSLNNRIDTVTGSLNTLTGTFNTFTSSFTSFSSSVDQHINAIDTFTSSVVYTNQTSSMTVLSASYATTAAFALNVIGGGGGISDGAFVYLNQTTPSTTWTFNHNLGQKYPIFQVFDSNDNVIIPSQITAVSADSATITFPSAQTGRVIASLGTGPGGMTEEFSAATTWSLSHNMGTDYPIVTVYDNNRKIIFPQEIKSIDSNNIEVYFSAPVSGHLNVAKGGHIISGSVSIGDIDLVNSGIVSSSAQVTAYGFATTGSNQFNGNQSVSGSLTVNKVKMDATCVSLSAVTGHTIFDLGVFDGANFDYLVKSGNNMRGGMIMGVWDGTTSKFNEVSTTDIGNTSNVTFNVTNNGRLQTTITSGTWTIEVMYRALGCS